MEFEAHAGRDIAFRNRAVALSSALQAFVRTITSSRTALASFVSRGVATAEMDLPEGFMQGVGLHESGLLVTLAPIMEGGPLAAARPYPDLEIALFMLPPLDWTGLLAAAADRSRPKRRAQAMRALEYFQEYIDNWFAANHSVVVHELIHVLDFLRSENRILPKRPPKSASMYVNSPVELNAFFQQMVVELEEQMKALPSAAQELVLTDFDAFVDQALLTPTAPDFFPFLEEKNARKVRVRLWQVWDRMRGGQS